MLCYNDVIKGGAEMQRPKELKVRRVGNSLGAIFPNSWGLSEGDTLPYEEQDEIIHLQLHDAAVKHDRELVEKSFEDFENGLIVSNEEMVKQFGKYGWQA